ncbi:hypothetical protein ABPG74_017355 [Tetrahymena malaccensis]
MKLLAKTLLFIGYLWAVQCQEVLDDKTLHHLKNPKQYDSNLDAKIKQGQFGKRNLVSSNYPYKIQFDYTGISGSNIGTNGLTSNISAYLQNITKMSSFYLSKLIYSDSTISSITTASCGTYTPALAQTYTNINIVIMVSFVNSPTNSFLTSSDTCQRDSTTQRPILGLLTFNIAILIPLPLNDNYDFKQHFKISTQEIIRIFGFRLDQLQYWINPVSTSTPQSAYGTAGVQKSVINSVILRGFTNTLFLQTPYTTKTAQDYYNCNTAQGMQLENQENLSVANARLDFERTILYNEALTANILDGNSVFSIFTGSLLKDMGYFSLINFNFLDDITFGQNEGCDFLSKVCQPPSSYPEFNYGGGLQCDFYGQGIGQNTADSFVDPGCVITQVTKSNLCENFSTDTSTRQIGGQTSKCFSSSAVQYLQTSTLPNARCHEMTCSSDFKTIFIRLLPNQQLIPICTLNTQGQTVNLHDFTSNLSDQTGGSLACPKNYKTFCLQPSRCPNNCSMNGFCIRNNCVCQDYYAGLDCSNQCSSSTPYWNGAQCVASCPVNLYANPNNTCLQSCPDGYYIDSGSGSCKQCDQSCRTCSNSNICISCNYPFVLDVSGTKCQLICNSVCLQCFGISANQCFSCIDGYYLSGYSCLQCQAPCQKCSSQVSCLSCISNYTYNSANQTCSPNCHSSCQTCSSPADPSKCLTCQSDSYLNLGQCLKCQSPCSSCSGTSTNCTSCITSYNLVNGYCYPKCIANCAACSDITTCNQCFTGYFYQTSPAPVRCVQCPSNCISCTSSVICTDCLYGYTLNGSNQCIALVPAPDTKYNCLTSQSNPTTQCLTCSTGYFLNNQICQKCDPNCFSCQGQSDYCTSCPNKSYLNTSTNQCQFQCDPICLTCSAGLDPTQCITCQVGYALIGQAPNSCTPCLNNCKKCVIVNSTQNCLSCVLNYQLSGTVCNPICDASCLTCSQPYNSSACQSCSPGYYLNSQSQCQPCTSPCSTCQTSSTNCNSCITNYNLIGSQCFPTNCDSSCLTCSVPQNPNNCTSCRNGFYLNSVQQCQPCDSTTSFCQNCVSLSSYCTSCVSNYQLIGSTCKPICAQNCATCTQPLLMAFCTACQDGYFLNSGNCTPCQQPCKTCDQSSGTICKSCISQYTLIGTNCVLACDPSCSQCSQPNNSNACQQCSPNYFQPINTTSCQQCGANCIQCQGMPENCSICQNNYTSINGVCVFNCSSNCRTCVDQYQFKCLSCYNGYYLDTLLQVCVKCTSPCNLCSSASICLSCLPNYQLNSATNQCLPICDVSCAANQCSVPQSQTSCTACNPNYFLQVTSNPSSPGSNIQKCIQCQSPCQNCTGSANFCTSCVTYYVLQGNTCVPNCGNNCQTCIDPSDSNTCTQCNQGYYLSVTMTPTSIIKQCIACLSPCSNCQGSTTVCTSCVTNYTLYGNACIPNCHSSCKTCQLPLNSSSCLSCNPGFFLSGSGTTGSCLPCQPPCSTCVNDPTNCLSCNTDYYLSLRPVVTPTLQNQCLPQCDSTCMTCKLPKNNQYCLTCIDGLYLQLLDSNSGKCFPCKSECFNCINPTQCTSCQHNYQFDPATSQCLPSNCSRTCQSCSLPYNDNACTSCYSDSWFDSSSKQCNFCNFPCKTCSGSSTNCASCVQNYSLVPQSNGINTCKPNCDPSCLTCSQPLNPNACLTCRSPKYVLNTSNQCVSCLPQCTSCNGTVDNCQSCITGYQLVSINPNYQTCNIICSVGCSSCLGVSSYCLSCISGYVYDSGLKLCKLVCDPSCFSCSYSYSPNSCTQCWPGYYIKSNQCLPCQKGTYSNYNECIDCLDNCIECSNQSTCNKCRAGYSLSSNNQSCILNQFQTIIVTTDCNYSCATCIDQKYTSCVTCAGNRQLSNFYFTSIGECICPPSYSDNGSEFCDLSATQSSIKGSNAALYAASAATTLILSTLASNPITFVGYLEITQQLSYITYVNFQSKMGLDQNMQMLYLSHISNIFPLNSIGPTQQNTPLTQNNLRNLQNSQREIMLSEYDTGVNKSQLQINGNGKFYLNKKTPYFAINSIPIIVISATTWILSFLASFIKTNENSMWKSKLKNFLYKSLPTVFFIISYQELSLLIFFQFQVFNFETSLDGFSSLYSIFAFLYQIGFLGYLIYLLEIKGIFKNTFATKVISQAQTNAFPSSNTIKSQDVNQNIIKSKAPRLNLKEQSVVPLQIVPEYQEVLDQNHQEFKKSYWILEEYLSHETLLKRIFIFIFFLNKTITSIIQVTSYDDPILQSSLIFAFNFLFIAYVIISNPFKNKIHFICYLICEGIILLTNMLILILVNTSDQNSSSQTSICLAVLSFTIILLCFYFLISIIALIKIIHLYCVKKDKILANTILKQPNINNSTNLTYKRSQIVLSNFRNLDNTQTQQFELKQQIYNNQQYKNVANDSIMSQTKYTQNHNDSILQVDEDFQITNQKPQFSSNLDLKKFISRKQDMTKLRNNFIFNNQNSNQNVERTVLLDDASNLFHFIPPRQKYQIQPALDELLKN